jgi:nitroreductase
MNILEKLNWRYATKKFDKNYELTDLELENIKSVIQLSASSYGLQPYKIFIVKDPKVRENLRKVSYDQTQITDSSAVLVFARVKNLETSEVDEFVDNIVNTRGVTKEMIADYEGMMKYSITSRTDEQKGIWIEKQIYLALGNLLSSLSVLGIDSCPMEGFDSNAYDEILGLQDLKSVVICTIGKRDETDDYQNYKKVRKPLSELFETI